VLPRQARVCTRKVRVTHRVAKGGNIALACCLDAPCLRFRAASTLRMLGGIGIQACLTTLEVTIGPDGMVRRVQHIGSATDRPQITPWIVMLVQASQPFPAAPQGEVVYRDTWRITAEGRFQLDAVGDARDLLASGRQR
jgi:hypothetical protein